ncbi:hypothetical protein AGIG_G5361 [Arapaima gigas]
MFDNLHCVLPSTPPLRPPPPPQLDHASLHTPVRRHAHHLIRDSPALRPATTWRQLCTALPNLTRRLLVEGLCLDHHTCAALKDLQRQNAVQQLSPTKRRREKGSRVKSPMEGLGRFTGTRRKPPGLGSGWWHLGTVQQSPVLGEGEPRSTGEETGLNTGPRTRGSDTSPWQPKVLLGSTLKLTDKEKQDKPSGEPSAKLCPTQLLQEKSA